MPALGRMVSNLLHDFMPAKASSEGTDHIQFWNLMIIVCATKVLTMVLVMLPTRHMLVGIEHVALQVWFVVFRVYLFL